MSLVRAFGVEEEILTIKGKEKAMVVEQEMAEIYPPDAEELSEFLPETDCGKCGFADCLSFAESLIEGQANPPAVPSWSPNLPRRLFPSWLSTRIPFLTTS